jgi:cysteine sulfinate desulfinase/cysteine desulfurase-like protein
MGLDYHKAKAALRVSLSVDTRTEELRLALQAIVERALASAEA